MVFEHRSSESMGNDVMLGRVENQYQIHYDLWTTKSTYAGGYLTNNWILWFIYPY
jgi:hypothetical protein